MPHKDMGITYNDVAALVNNEDSYGFLDGKQYIKPFSLNAYITGML